MIFVGNLLFYEAVGTFVFEEQDGVGISDGALDHGLGVGRKRWRDYLEARCIAEPGLDALGVVEGASRHDAVWRPDGDGAIPIAVRAVVELGCFVDDLVECRRDKVSELYLGHGAHTVHREAYGRAHDQALSQRRVHYPLSTELLLQPLRNPENTTGPAYVLAEHHYRLVRAHLLGEYVFGVGEWGVLSVLARLCDLSLYALRDLIPLRLIQDAVLHEVLLESDDGVLLAPLLYLFAFPVPSVVVV